MRKTSYDIVEETNLRISEKVLLEKAILSKISLKGI